MRDLLLLQLRNAIADKEWVTSCANMETANRSAWSCDWYSQMRESDETISLLITELNHKEE